jgi:hypothetical protein
MVEKRPKNTKNFSSVHSKYFSDGLQPNPPLDYNIPQFEFQKSQNSPYFELIIINFDDLNGSVGSIADLKPKGPGFESRISQGFFLM